jgi:hypothetical protein
MGPIRISDIFTAPVYLSYVPLNNPEQSRFITSGIMARSATLDAIAKTGGKKATVPFWQDIDPSIEPNYSNDDPADIAVPNKIGTGPMEGRKAWLNQGFSEMDLVVELTGEDALQHVRNRFGTYWVRQQERRLVAMAVGLMAANLANDGGDMVEDQSAVSFDGNMVIDAAYQLGENVNNLKAMAVHSNIMAKMVKNNDIEYVKDSEGNLTIPTYKGLLVIVTNSLPVTGAGADRVYTTIIYGNGAFGWGNADGSNFAVGEGIPKVPAAMTRSEETGNGGGMETIWERKTWMMHPFGFTWIDPTGANALVEFSPTLADLAKPFGWSRVVSRVQAPFVFLRSKA